jgi:hypothetical protein
MGILTLAFLRCWWRRFARRLIKRKQRRWQQSESQQQRQQFLFHNPYLPQKLGWHHSAPANWQIATHASPCSGYRSLVMRESNESLGSHRSQLKLSRHDRLVSAYRESNAKAKVLRPRNYLNLVTQLSHLSNWNYRNAKRKRSSHPAFFAMWISVYRQCPSTRIQPSWRCSQ